MRTNDRRMIPVLLLLCAAALSAQSTQEQKKEEVKPVKSATVLKDADADGVADAQDRQRNTTRTTERKRDMFIDANGDGICDSREQGLGFRRGNASTISPSGKRQQGRQK